MSKSLGNCIYLSDEPEDKDLFYRSECSFLKGTCLMYQGKLQQAEMYAQYAREEAQKSGNINTVKTPQYMI